MVFARMVTCALFVVAVAACGSSDPGQHTREAEASTGEAVAASVAPCAALGPKVDLGSHAFDQAPDRYVRTTAGRYRLTATGFLHGGLFDPKVGRTTVAWGLSKSRPVYHQGPSTVTGGLGSVDVVEGKDAWVTLPDATLWFLNSNGRRLTLQACAPATANLVVR